MAQPGPTKPRELAGNFAAGARSRARSLRTPGLDCRENTGKLIDLGPRGRGETPDSSGFSEPYRAISLNVKRGTSSR